jgi:hypothetical protein
MPFKDKMKQLEYIRQYYARPEIKLRRSIYRRTKYSEDPSYREKVKAKVKLYQQTYDKVPNSRYRLDIDYRERKRQKTRDYQRQLRELARADPTNPRVQRFVKYRKKYGSEHQKTTREALKTRAYAVHGTKCVLCDLDCVKAKMRIEFHEVNGKPHPSNHLRRVINHPEDYAPLCHNCHHMVSRIVKVFKLSWKEIIALKPK